LGMLYYIIIVIKNNIVISAFMMYTDHVVVPTDGVLRYWHSALPFPLG
jgi:hypothetical protein